MNVFAFALVPLIASQHWGDFCTQPDVKGLPFCNQSLPAAARANDFVDRLSIDEKQSLLHDGADAVPRFHLPGYRWWNEGLHGASIYKCRGNKSSGFYCPTSFPAPSAFGASFNDTLFRKIGATIGIEFRAINPTTKMGGGNIGVGLTVWAPVVNMQRDPRWGRNQEVAESGRRPSGAAS